MRLLIATRNKHKVQEIRSILGGQFEYSSLADFPDAPEVKEDHGTFEGNARKKAVEIASWLRKCGRHLSTPTIVLADDSGLEVDALGGEPGVHSARYAGKQGDDAANNRKLLEMLKNVPSEKRTARFRCVIAIAGPEGNAAIAQGACEGRIGFEPRGNNGFGYDPLFVPDGYEQTFAELGSDVKDKISHRARALEQAKTLVGAHGCVPNAYDAAVPSGRRAVHPQERERRSIRLKGYDYSRAGIYFVTLCTEGRTQIFGNVSGGKIELSGFGHVVAEEWQRSQAIRKEIRLHEWIVMPNHFHGLLQIVGAHGGASDGSQAASERAHSRAPLRRPRSLASMVAGFKAASTKRINELRNAQGSPVWQRNYYEHVVRSEEDFHRIRRYILTNPGRWELDRENENRTGVDEFDEWLNSL